MREIDLGGERSFIGAWYLSDLAICDEVLPALKAWKRSPAVALR